MGLLECAGALTRAACTVNMLQVLIAHYVFTQVRCMHCMSSSDYNVALELIVQLRIYGMHDRRL